MISKKNRLKLKNQFDGSIVFSGREFDDRTGRTLHMANCENIIDDKLINEKTGLIKDEYVFNRRCPLCNEPDKHETIFVKQGFNHAKCVKCGFVFVNNPFNEGILHDKYEKEDSWSEVLLNDINIDMDTKKFKYGLMLIESVFDDYKLQLNKNLLDVGSGSGLFLKVARDNGWNVKGIEFNEKTRNFSRMSLG